MEFDEFKEQLAEDLKQALYERDIEVRTDFNTVNKLNETYEAVTITPEGSNVGVNINVSGIYAEYESGIDYSEILSKTIDTVERGINDAPEVDVASLTDYNQMKEKLVMEVVSVETNRDMLEKIPHKEIEDMAIVYRFDLGEFADGRSSILVTNQIINTMGVTPEQLHNDAMETAPMLRPLVIRGMTEVIAEMTGMSREDMIQMGMAPGGNDEMMYVASSSDSISGAGVIAYQNFMDQAAEKVGGDFFILPSSRHEVLIVPDDGTKSLKELEAMVREVNATQVRPEDKLTDSVYHYDSKAKVFELGEKFVERISEKTSVLDELKIKKDEAAKQPKKDVIDKGAKSKNETTL